MTPDALVTPDGTFEQFTGHRPYLWQQRLIETGLPETLEIPTGCGKTEAVFTAWAYRRRLHPDSDVRAGIPRRLVWVLPQRSLVEQTVSRIRRWVSNAGWGTPDATVPADAPNAPSSVPGAGFEPARRVNSQGV